MRSVCYAAGVVLIAGPIVGFAETRVPCDQSLSHALQSRAVLSINSRPAGIHIVGTDQDAIHVSCTAGSDEVARKVALHFSPKANGGFLSIEGPQLEGGNNGIDVKIEVPRRTNVSVRMFAGQVTMEEVKGDKDIDLGAGQITISTIHDGDYRSVNASVDVGEVQARAFGSDKGGFFRRFSRKNASGDYRLEAHVTTGEIDLLGNAEQEGGRSKPD